LTAAVISAFARLQVDREREAHLTGFKAVKVAVLDTLQRLTLKS